MPGNILQYKHRETFFHNLDPTIKLLSVIIFSIFLFFINSLFQLLLLTSLIILVFLISEVSIYSAIRNILPFLFFFAFILIAYYIFYNINDGIIVVYRFFLMIIVSSVLIYTTSITQLTYGLQKLLQPLKLIRINPRDIALMVSVAIRFIPQLLDEAKNIKDAQKSRGANFRKIKNVTALVISLINKTFARANAIAESIESRCYGNKNHTHMRNYKAGLKDYSTILFLISFLLIVKFY